MRRSFRTIVKDIAHGLAVCHDYSRHYTFDIFHNKMRLLMVSGSPSQTTEGNGCSRRFIRTIETVEDLRLALLAFRNGCTTIWFIQRFRRRSTRSEKISFRAIAA